MTEDTPEAGRMMRDLGAGRRTASAAFSPVPENIKKPHNVCYGVIFAVTEMDGR